MTWTRFESRYPQSRKVKPLSDGAFRADVEGICWANEEGTDGQIRADELELVGDGKRKPKHAAELVRRGRWHASTEPACPSDQCPHDGTAPDGWVIHDFHGYNPTRAEVERERAAKAERQKRWRDRKSGRFTGSTSRDASTQASRNASVDASRDVLRDATPHRSAPPRSEGSGGGAPPSDLRSSSPPAAAADAVAGDGGGQTTQPPRRPADPEHRQAKAAEARAALAAANPPRVIHDRPGAFAELMALTRTAQDRASSEPPKPEDQETSA